LNLAAFSSIDNGNDGSGLFSSADWMWISSVLGAGLCLFGVAGVLHKNVKYLNMFAAFYFVEVAASIVFTTVLSVAGASMKEDICKSIVGQPDANGNTPEDNEKLIKQCEEKYPQLLTVAIVGMCIGIAIRLYFYLAIRAYAKQVQREQLTSDGFMRVVHIVPAGYQSYPAQPVLIQTEQLPAYTPANEKTPLV
jgi:hypothetical protein